MTNGSKTTKHYRVACNEWNVKNPPWTDAIGIEEVEVWPSGEEIYAVPAIVCWITRGTDIGLISKIVEGLNHV
jgi:hypothetical protein